MLDNTYAILFVRGERAVRDQKYDILKHPNVADTEDGGAEPYVHGKVSGDVAKIRVEQVLQLDAKDAQTVSSESGYELLSENDLLEEIGKEEKEENENEKRTGEETFPEA